MNRIKLINDGFVDSYCQNQLPANILEGIDLCADGVYQEARIPDDTQTIDIVFTKRRIDGYSWPINILGHVSECRDQYFLAQTRKVFAAQYREGYSFFHLEYTE